MKVIGGLGALKQYNQFESPFWRETISKLSNGRIKATIHPFDKSGLRGEDMLQLIRMGVVPFGTALMGLVVGDEPELNGIFLASLGFNGQSIRSTVENYRPYFKDVLRKRYGIELLAIYAYPAQVIYCIQPFRGLADLQGRRIRTSHVGQADLMMALGATPVVMPFIEIEKALKRGDLDCVITGTSAGNESELLKITKFVSELPITPGLSMFAANSQAWAALPEDIRKIIMSGIADLENRLWETAETDTRDGIACNIGSPDCKAGKPGQMTLVPATAEDRDILRHLLASHLLPNWINRCGETCIQTWNNLMSVRTGLKVVRQQDGTPSTETLSLPIPLNAGRTSP